MFMDNSTWTILFLAIVFVFFIVLFAVVDYVTKGKKKAKSVPAPAMPEAAVPSKTNVLESPVLMIDTGSNFFNEITALITPQEQKKEEKTEVASQRSRMYNRRAQMSEYRQKYQSRTVDFDSENYDKPLSSQPSSFLVEGIEISQDDVRKLTALHGLFTRKTDAD